MSKMSDTREEVNQLLPGDEVIRIALQAEETFNSKGYRWDTYFYKVVLAGNVKVIKQVVSFLEGNGSTKTLDWLFKRNKFEEKRHIQKKTSGKIWLTRILMFMILALVNIVVTPIFYALHISCATFLNRKQRRISANIRLPLAYAAFSQRQEMVVFFLYQGVDVAHIDHHDNNVFHYISDLSSVASDKAIQIFSSVIKQINDVNIVKKLLEHDRNSAGLTAVEYAAKFGSPSLLTQILNQPNIMHHTPFSASADHVVFNEAQEDETPCEHDASARLELVDVSRYEAGGITDQSNLLNILSDRDVGSMSKKDLQIFSDTHFMGKWLVMKCRQMVGGVFLFHLCDFILTCLMVLVLSTTLSGKNGHEFLSWRLSEFNQVYLKELQAWTKNTSSIFKPHVIHENTKNWCLREQHFWLYEQWLQHPRRLQHLLNVTSLEHKLNAVPNVPTTKWNATFSVLDDADMDVIFQQVLKMPQFVNDTERLRIIRMYPKIIVELAKELISKNEELFDGDEFVLSNTDRLQKALNNFTVKDETGNIIMPSSALLSVDFHSMVCPPIEKFDDLKNVPPFVATNVHDVLKFVGYSCAYQTFINIAFESEKCKISDNHVLLRTLFRFDMDAYSRITPIIMLFCLICAYMYIIIDVLERCVFLTNSVVHQTSPRDMIIATLGQKVPGSYVRKQLNMFSCIVILIHFYFDKYVESLIMDFQTRVSPNMILEYMSYVTMMFIVVIVIRFLMHIHSLRLLPGIGHFIITTFMMGTNLLHFSAVFGIVMLIFSVLFHILIDDPDCPLEKSEGFVTLIDSIFSTFKLTFGHGEMEGFFSSAPVKLTYVLYVIIVGLLLLNLIIAIMSTTAMEIMAEPWRGVLWKIEWLDEATSVEYTLSVITLPFRKLRGCGYFSHRKAGYIVKEMPNGVFKVYIKHFHCPALQEQVEE